MALLLIASVMLAIYLVYFLPISEIPGPGQNKSARVVYSWDNPLTEETHK